MNRQRKVVITVTYNDLGTIIDTKAKELDLPAQPNLQLTCNKLATDLISRQAAIDVLHGYFDGMLETDTVCPVDIYGLFECIPSAQLERKKGQWIPVDSYSAFGGDEATWMAHGNPVAFYYCSECKEQAYAGEDGESLITDYCPNCGADMRCERNEDD